MLRRYCCCWAVGLLGGLRGRGSRAHAASCWAGGEGQGGRCGEAPGKHLEARGAGGRLQQGSAWRRCRLAAVVLVERGRAASAGAAAGCCRALRARFSSARPACGGGRRVSCCCRNPSGDLGPARLLRPASEREEPHVLPCLASAAPSSALHRCTWHRRTPAPVAPRPPARRQTPPPQLDAALAARSSPCLCLCGSPPLTASPSWLAQERVDVIGHPCFPKRKHRCALHLIAASALSGPPVFFRDSGPRHTLRSAPK